MTSKNTDISSWDTLIIIVYEHIIQYSTQHSFHPLFTLKQHLVDGNIFASIVLNKY
jgi:hypothetical protein